nr:MAG TPA: hypothetical protein [Caudoviricetes sp.]
MSRLFILELRFPYNALQYFSYLSFFLFKKINIFIHCISPFHICYSIFIRAYSI